MVLETVRRRDDVLRTDDGGAAPVRRVLAAAGPHAQPHLPPDIDAVYSGLGFHVDTIVGSFSVRQTSSETLGVLERTLNRTNEKLE